MLITEHKKKTKTQLLQYIAILQKQNDELKALERECRLLAEDLKSKNENIERQKKDLEILHKISHAVHQSLDLKNIYNIALEGALTLQDVDMAFIYLISDNRMEAVLQANRNLTEDYIRRAGRIPYPKGVTWKVLNSGQVFNIEDIQMDNDVGPAGKDMGHHRALGIPIILDGIVMGVIWLASYKKGRFNKAEIELNVSIGNHIGMAVAKAKLYEEMEARVIDRTAELKKANLFLRKEIEERKRVENEMRIVRERHEIVNAIKNLLKDEQYVTPSLAEKLAIDIKTKAVSQNLLHERLSNREYKVMIMIASGKSTNAIAKDIYLSPSTVSTYRRRILEKLNLKTTAELIRYTIKNNLID